MNLETRITATYTADDIRALIAKDLKEKGYTVNEKEVDFVIDKNHISIGPHEQAETYVLTSAKVLVNRK